MKLQKLNLDNLEKFKVKNPSRIFGGGTCVGTCCPEEGPTGCEDWEDDDPASTQIIA